MSDASASGHAAPADATTGTFASDPLAAELELQRERAPSLEPGTVLAGRFHVLEEIGRGGMGVVYAARDARLHEDVAIKIIRPERSPSAASRELFLREVRLARRLAHPGIVRIFELGEHQGQSFVAMERLEGEDLRAVLERRGRLPALEALDVILQACDALDAAHSEGIVHGDIKPTNLFLTSAGGVKVLDFGLAWVPARDDGPSGAPRLRGTPAYMAPEQRDRARFGAPGPATDVWALARVLTELLVGRDEGEPDHAVPDFPERETSVPVELARVLHAAMADDPADRPANAAALGRALKACAQDLAPRELPLARLAAIAALGAVLVLLTATATEVALRRWQRAAIGSALEERQLSRAAALALAAFPDARGSAPWFRTLASTVADRGHALLRAGRTLEAIETFKLARELGGDDDHGLARAREARAVEIAARRAPPPGPPLALEPAAAVLAAPPPTHTRASIRSAHAAALYFDDRPLGLTPFEGELPLGLHRMRLVDLDTGRSHDEIVTLTADAPFERTPVLGDQEFDRANLRDVGAAFTAARSARHGGRP